VIGNSHKSENNLFNRMMQQIMMQVHTTPCSLR